MKHAKRLIPLLLLALLLRNAARAGSRRCRAERAADGATL